MVINLPEMSFYDGLDADKLIETLNSSINGIVGNLGNKLNEFPNK